MPANRNGDRGGKRMKPHRKELAHNDERLFASVFANGLHC